MKKFAVWWSLWRHALPAFCNALLSVVCYAVGWSLSDAESAVPLARAGAFATMIAIGFTLHDFRQALEEGEKSAVATFATATKHLPLTGQASQKRIEEILRSNTRRASKVITTTHAIVLMLATFVWGFGDLATRWM
jgi:hypothetical protein